MQELFGGSGQDSCTHIRYAIQWYSVKAVGWLVGLSANSASWWKFDQIHPHTNHFFFALRTVFFYCFRPLYLVLLKGVFYRGDPNFWVAIFTNLSLLQQTFLLWLEKKSSANNRDKLSLWYGILWNVVEYGRRCYSGEGFRDKMCFPNPNVIYDNISLSSS